MYNGYTSAIREETDEAFTTRIETRSQIVAGFSVGLFFLAGFLLSRKIPARVYLPFIYFIIMAIILSSISILILNIPTGDADTFDRINDIKLILFTFAVGFLLAGMIFYIRSEVYLSTGNNSIFSFDYYPVTELPPKEVLDYAALDEYYI